MASKDLTKMTKAEVEERYNKLIDERDAIRDELDVVKTELDQRLTMERTAAILGVDPETLDREDWEALAKIAAKAGPPPGSVTAEVALLQSEGSTKDIATK